jgi:hypothetical protein
MSVLVRALRFVAVTCTALICQGAFAVEYFGAPGSVGVLDESSHKLARMDGAALSFRRGAVGSILARYPLVDIFVDPTQPTPRFLGMGYVDPGPTTRVVIKLIGVRIFDGESTEIMRLDSDMISSPSASYQFNAICDASLELDFPSNTYYLEATISRAVDTAEVGLYQVRWYNQDASVAGCSGGAGQGK